MQSKEWSSRSSSKKSSWRNFSLGCFQYASGAVCDVTAPHVPGRFHPVSRTRCQGCGGHSWQWLIYVQHEEGLRFLVTPDIFALLWRGGADEDNVPYVLDCKPAAHINQSHCIFPSLTMAKTSVPLILKTATANPTQSVSAEVVEDLWEDTVTGVGGFVIAKQEE